MEYAVNTYCQRFFLPPTPAFRQYMLNRASNVSASTGAFEPPAYQNHA